MPVPRYSGPKLCGRCKVTRLPRRTANDKVTGPYCKSCAAAYTRELRTKSPGFREKERRHELRRRYQITPEEYDFLLKKQKGRCAICRTKTPGGSGLRVWQFFAVDHNHRTSKVRGLLCAHCNRAIGIMKDSARLLRKAAEYLECTT